MNSQTKLKQTGIGKIPEDWEEIGFSEAVEVNPKRELKKGSIAKSVSMADIQPFTRKISNYTLKEFKGGSKFKNDDTLFARITPSLENGKTAFVDVLVEGETGFGSTEFIILAAKEGKTNPYFVYYLSRIPEVRNIAIRSMTGTSGRQRVENDVFDNIVIYLPHLTEQSAITKILSDLDSKIELNQQMNKTLEEMGKAIFKHWFIDFEFPNEKGKPYKSSGGEMVYNEELEKEIPKGWKTSDVDKEFNLVMGQSPPGSSYNELGEGVVFFQGRTDFGYRFPSIRMFCNEPTRFAKKGDTLISVRAPVGDINLALQDCCIGRGLAAIRHKSNHSSYTYYFMRTLKPIFDHFESEGTIFGSIGKTDFEKIRVLAPDKEIVNSFQNILDPIDKKIEDNALQILTLSGIRDSLLLKLMSGKIRVPVEVR